MTGRPVIRAYNTSTTTCRSYFLLRPCIRELVVVAQDPDLTAVCCSLYQKVKVPAAARTRSLTATVTRACPSRRFKRGRSRCWIPYLSLSWLLLAVDSNGILVRRPYIREVSKVT